MAADGDRDGDIARARREFAALLGEFRRTAVLVPLVDGDGLWSAESEGIRWIYAFTDEGALARWAMARGEADQEWAYRRVLGARLLDVVAPAMGVPCGVAVDVADGADAVLFPPVAGIVPDSVAVNARAVGASAAEGTA
ncbi:SseB family protein [Streptomyces sp. NPDC004647]|uniref:SseB family protein n=1 Tax=Streptomyces sp. NPDC004647 TaxID=3154671 RepID=UPI0033B8256E